jgi:hypothetical protein
VRSIFLSILLIAPTTFIAAADDSLTTIAERSKFQKTGRYDEVIELCAAFQKAYPKAVLDKEFGRTPEGRPMLALIVSRTGCLTAAQAHERGLPVLLVQGGIHAGEIDGKDAGFLVLREALEDRAAKGALDKLVFIFVPVFNVDGHERFGRWNRPNQRGPEEMGWRTTAQNLNLNRDYMKAEAPEMQAMLRFVNEWDPLAYIDLHVTDGAKFEHDVSIQVEPVHAGDVELAKAGAALQSAVISDLASQGSLPTAFYPSFAKRDDPSSGFVDQVLPPRYSHGYFQLRNRFGMLLETHSWKDYPTRVRVTHNAIVSLLSQIAAHGKAWLQTAHEADTRAADLGGQWIPLEYDTSPKSHVIDFHGYEYTRTKSDISGALMTRYDESRPQIWKVPFRDEIQPGKSVVAPQGGYLIPAANVPWVAEKLKLHDIAFRVLKAPLSKAAVETFRAAKTTFGRQSEESRQTLSVEGNWKADTQDFVAGSLFVPIAQPKSRLVMALLEPQAPDSFLAWGMFNGAFERKEYLEDYVAEEVAREQLAASPELSVEFQKKLADEPAFAASPAARLEFFARLHPSWDQRFGLYPVARIAKAPE